MYTTERNTQMLIYLMKKHGVRKVIASPGTTNICFIGSIQEDPYFEIYSSVDERSAAYIACGLAAESGEPVALSCTGATASRNYVPGMTEAYYRKLPVLAITSSQHSGRIGQLIPQVTDRGRPMNDIAKLSIQLPTIHDAEDEWACGVAINNALLELFRHGGGPVHINLITSYQKCFSVKEIPPVKVIQRVGYSEVKPKLQASRVAIYVGAHMEWNLEFTKNVERFCELYNGVVVGDHFSNYNGKYGISPSLLLSQDNYQSPCRDVDIMIHIGEVGAYGCNLKPKEVWRVSPDGEIRDTFKKLTKVFEMEEIDFFAQYISLALNDKEKSNTTYYTEFSEEVERIRAKVPELPFGNAWIAQHTGKNLPKGSVLYLGILNTVRNWGFFEISDNIQCYANTGGFGIDGMVSSLLGASLADPSKLHFGIVGDLGFFYDMNVLGNRHVGSNLRLMLINNGKGIEFKNYNHLAHAFGESADSFMAAAGHYGNKSDTLVRNYALALGFEYLCASDKEAYLENVERFLNPQILERPIIFEVFTNETDESNSLKTLCNLEISATRAAKDAIKGIIGENNIRRLKKVIKK